MCALLILLGPELADSTEVRRGSPQITVSELDFSNTFEYQLRGVPGSRMAFYTRILSPVEKVPSISSIASALAKENLAGVLRLESGADADWTQVVVSHKRGPDIADIERMTASSGDLVSEQIGEFVDEIADCKPTSAARWLARYLPTIKTIFKFRLLSGTDVRNGWGVLGSVRASIFSHVGGIIQADGEGFSNEDGCHILWQFSNSVKGPWWMSVLRKGRWVRFRMDLANKKHRAAFLRGAVPDGVESSPSARN